MLRSILRATPLAARLPVVAPVFVAPARTVYSELVQKHFDNPLNVGKLDRKDPHVGGATVGAPECGDVARMQLKVNPDTGVIEDVKMQVFGCGSAIASTSYVSELLKGRTISQALEISNKQIAAELSLPPVKLHCSLLAEEAIHAAVANYLQKQPQMKSMVTRRMWTCPRSKRLRVIDPLEEAECDRARDFQPTNVPSDVPECA